MRKAISLPERMYWMQIKQSSALGVSASKSDHVSTYSSYAVDEISLNFLQQKDKFLIFQGNNFFEPHVCNTKTINDSLVQPFQMGKIYESSYAKLRYCYT